jgi:hypothetical protein
MLSSCASLPRCAQPDRSGLNGGLLRTPLDLLLRQGAERVVDHDGDEVVHAERIALHLCLVQEFRRDDDRRRTSGGFQSDAVMRTARRT